MDIKNSISIIAIALLLASCEKTIDLDYKDNQSQIVIEGNITNEAGPYIIKVTKSLPLTGIAAYPTIDDAEVIICDDANNRETLIRQGNGIYHTTTIAGVEGRTYTLIVNAESQTYTAQSTMPKQVPFDSIRIEETSFVGDTEYKLIPVYKDPIEKGNNYRFVLSVNNKRIGQHLVLNDEVKNGQTNTLKLEINDNDLELSPSDCIGIEMQCIDKQASSFYTALALMANRGPGTGITPNNPPNNLSNGALGIFSAHTVERRNVMIP